MIRVQGKQVELVEMGALHLTKYKDHAVKLKRIFDRCAALIETHTPDHLAVEARRFLGKNVQSMLKLGRAQGVALAGQLFVTGHSRFRIRPPQSQAGHHRLRLRE